MSHVAARCIVLDFDGTFTDVEKEAVPFLATYKDGLARFLDASIDDAWAAAERDVRTSPDRHGFEDGGRIVAPSHADPYILAASVARLVLSRRAYAGEDSTATLNELFREAYAVSDTAFRPDAKEVIEAILALDLPVYVISNSHTDHVLAKLERLAPRGGERLRVRGEARKFHLVAPVPSDPRFDRLPESIAVRGLERPVYLRRGRYFEALRRVWDEIGVGPEETVVCGDIFELDLALPSQLGAATHLVTRPSTPAYERDAVEAHGGTYSADLAGLLPRLRDAAL